MRNDEIKASYKALGKGFANMYDGNHALDHHREANGQRGLGA